MCPRGYGVGGAVRVSQGNLVLGEFPDMSGEKARELRNLPGMALLGPCLWWELDVEGLVAKPYPIGPKETISTHPPAGPPPTEVKKSSFQFGLALNETWWAGVGPLGLLPVNLGFLPKDERIVSLCLWIEERHDPYAEATE